MLLCGLITISVYLLYGCGKPPAAATNEPLTDAEAELKPVLSQAEQREVLGILESLAEDHELSQRPTTGPPRGRWRDVPGAAAAAAAEAEMAIVRREDTDDGYIFHLVTIEQWPGRLHVQRAAEPRIWSATARIGMFDQREKRADELLKLFEQKMRAMSRKPKFPEHAR